MLLPLKFKDKFIRWFKGEKKNLGRQAVNLSSFLEEEEEENREGKGGRVPCDWSEAITEVSLATWLTGREGSFREKIRGAKEPEKSFLQQRQKKGNVNSFLRDSEKQADCGSRTAASLEAVSLEQSFLTVGKGTIKDKRIQRNGMCVLVCHLWPAWRRLATETGPGQG